MMRVYMDAYCVTFTSKYIKCLANKNQILKIRKLDDFEQSDQFHSEFLYGCFYWTVITIYSNTGGQYESCA